MSHWIHNGQELIHLKYIQEIKVSNYINLETKEEVPAILFKGDTTNPKVKDFFVCFATDEERDNALEKLSTDIGAIQVG